MEHAFTIEEDDGRVTTHAQRSKNGIILALVDVEAYHLEAAVVVPFEPIHDGLRFRSALSAIGVDENKDRLSLLYAGDTLKLCEGGRRRGGPVATGKKQEWREGESRKACTEPHCSHVHHRSHDTD